MTTSPRSLAELQVEAVRLLAVYQGTPPEERTPVLRNLARVLVAARREFLTDSGEPDYRGLTHAYRAWVHNVYDSAHIERDVRPTLQAAVRYHAGSVLREQLDEETLTRLGLIKQTPKERSSERRTARNALLNALSHGELDSGDMLALSAAHSMLRNVRGDDFENLTDGDRAVVGNSLVQMQRRVAALLERLRPAEGAGGKPDQDADGPDYTADE